MNQQDENQELTTGFNNKRAIGDPDKGIVGGVLGVQI